MANRRDVARNQTATPDFGHSWARVPDWLHIGAYPHAFPDRGRLQYCYEAPANEPILCLSALEGDLIAMQKVEGSNPFSRLASNPLHLGHSALAGENQTTAAYRRFRPTPPATARAALRDAIDAGIRDDACGRGAFAWGPALHRTSSAPTQ
jgi:hypothetical protein